jgi:hypothetical protein
MTVERIPTNRGNVPLRKWWKKVGADAVKKVCARAQIEYPHFKHVAAGRRRFSPDAARVFAAASGLTFQQLIPPRKVPRKATP